MRLVSFKACHEGYHSEYHGGWENNGPKSAHIRQEARP